MAKRFTDSEKWKDSWFMDLPSKYKLFWLYILDECNHAGIWKVNFKVAIFYIGENLEYSEVKRTLQDRILILDDNYWYIEKFIKFQYKCDIQGLKVRNKAHLSVLNILNEYDKFKPLVSPLLGVKDKDKDKDKDLDKEKEQDKDVLISIENCKEKYLNDERLKKAIKENLKIPDLESRLTDFNKHLETQSEYLKKWNDYTSHFLNWHKKNKVIKNNNSPTSNLVF